MSVIKAVILASGTGSRFNDCTPKQFIKLAGLPVIVHTLRVFDLCPRIDGVVVVTQEEYVEQTWLYVSQHDLRKVCKVVVGGETRQDSSRIGISCCGADTEYVLVHDAVRPFVTNLILENMIDAVIAHGAVDTVIPSPDTIVEVDSTGFIANIPDRSRMRRGQTPQAFSYPLIVKAHRQACTDGIENATDDCALVLRLGHKVFVVPGDEQNVKITYPLDLHIADKLFQLKVRTAEDGENRDILRDKVFVVIGGTSGIGKELVDQLRLLSRKVYCFSRSTVPAVDVTSLDSLEKTLTQVADEAGAIDYIINCSGDLIRKNVENTSLEEWQHIFATNTTGAFLVAKAMIPIVKSQKKGALFFIGSSSYTRGREGYAAYSSSKAALVNFCQALAEELSGWNIRVNVISPSRVNTPLRFKNFGNEKPETLLAADLVARECIKILAVETTGSVFEIS
jgi:2-C-methyl-D-erythritol 4-phosphate cytidylyltransferase